MEQSQGVTATISIYEFDDQNYRVPEDQIEARDLDGDDHNESRGFPDGSRETSDGIELSDEKAPLEPGPVDLEVLDDSVRMYLGEIGRTDLLTFQDEQELARRLEVKNHLLELEEELNVKGGRAPLPWEITGVLLCRLADAGQLLAGLEQLLGLPHNLTLTQISSHPQLRIEIDGKLSQSLVASLADAFDEKMRGGPTRGS